MYKTLLLVSTLIGVTPVFSTEKSEAKDTAIKPEAAAAPNHSHSICDNITQSLSHLNDEKAKGVITAFCALSPHGDASYVDKLQVTINIQGNDATYTEKHKYKDNYGTKNKYINDDGYDPNCPYCVNGESHPEPAKIDNVDDNKSDPTPDVPNTNDKDEEKDASDKPGEDNQEDTNLDENTAAVLDEPKSDNDEEKEPLKDEKLEESPDAVLDGPKLDNSEEKEPLKDEKLEETPDAILDEPKSNNEKEETPVQETPNDEWVEDPEGINEIVKGNIINKEETPDKGEEDDADNKENISKEDGEINEDTKEPSLLEMIQNPKKRQKGGFKLDKDKSLSSKGQLEKAQSIIDSKKLQIEKLQSDVKTLNEEEREMIKAGTPPSAAQRKKIIQDRDEKRKDLATAMSAIKFQEQKLKNLGEVSDPSEEK